MKMEYIKEAYNDEYFFNMEAGINSNPAAIIFLNDLMSVIYGTKVLSIGCGTGITEYRIKTQMPHIKIIGTDFAETETQKELWNKYGLEAIVADGSQQPFRDESFDTSFTSHVLEHVVEPQKVIEESIRVTRWVAVHLIPINLNHPDHIHFFKFGDIDNEYRTQDADIDLKVLADKVISNLRAKLPKIEYEVRISCPRDGSKDYGDMAFPIKRPDRPDGLMPCFLITFHKYGKSKVINLKGRIVMNLCIDTLKRRIRKINDGFYQRSIMKDTYVCNICNSLNLSNINLKKSKYAPSTYERILCTNCGSTMRYRSLIHVFNLYYPNRDKGKQGIGLTDPPCVSNYLKKDFNYKNTFFNDRIDGEYIDVLRFTDFCSLESLDFIIASDVFEHVSNLELALSECYKVLKPSGKIFVTVPIIYKNKHYKLAMLENSKNKIPKSIVGVYFHGNAFAYREVGYEEFLRQLINTGFFVVKYNIDCPQSGIFEVNLAIKKPIIVAIKPDK